MEKKEMNYGFWMCLLICSLALFSCGDGGLLGNDDFVECDCVETDKTTGITITYTMNNDNGFCESFETDYIILDCK